MADESAVKTWHKRILAAKKLKDDADTANRVEDCYNYWRGEQLKEPIDEFSQRRVQINKIHPEVANNLPSLYFYRPFARIAAEPERADDPGSAIEESAQLLQDTVNHIIRDPNTRFKDATFLALKEAHWSMGCVEVGYSAKFSDTLSAERPPLKERDDTKIKAKSDPSDAEEKILENGDPNDPMALMAELQSLKANIKSEHFYVKYICADQVLVSISDKPLVEDNDWIGYWEDMPLEDVKKSKAYSNTKDLKAVTADPEKQKEIDNHNEENGSVQSVRLYKIWSLRDRVKYVVAEGHDEFLMCKRYERLPLKFLRFDIDPYHFFPRPLILSKLAPQDEYNHSREYLRKVRQGTVPRYTYDDQALTAENMQKLESGDMGTYIPRKGNTANVIEPVNQPSFSENAIQTLTLADKELQDVGGVGGDSRIAKTKTATQAKIAESKDQAQDNFQRTQVAEFLADVARELLSLAIENMRVDQWIAINIPADTMYAQQLGQDIAMKFQKINAQVLSDRSNGLTWNVLVDIESISPISEQEKFQKWMMGLELLANPAYSRLFSVAPPLLQQTLKYMGLNGAKDQGILAQALQQVVLMEQAMASMGQAGQQGMPSKPKQAGEASQPAPAPAPPPQGPPGGQA